jgi:hypothetical protein
MLVLLVSPVTLSIVWWRIRTSAWFQKVVAHPTQNPWTMFFPNESRIGSRLA